MKYQSFIDLYLTNKVLLDEKNFAFDYIGSFLHYCENQELEECQWVKHGLNITIKIHKFQEDIFGDVNFDYCNIRNQKVDDNGNMTWVDSAYYFIKEIRRVSSECAEFVLKMDVLNTIYMSNHIDLSEKTTILREHKNRWKAGTYQGGYFPVIDLYSEGINVPLFKKKEATLYANLTQMYEPDFSSYYLIFRSHTDDEHSPIDVLLCGDTQLQTKERTAGWSGGFNPRSQLKAYWWGCLYGSDTYGTHTNVGAKVIINDETYDGSGITLTVGANNCILIGRETIFYCSISNNGISILATYQKKNGTSFKNLELQDVWRLRVDDTRATKNMDTTQFCAYWTPTLINSLPYASDISPGLVPSDYVCTINDIDRTDPLLLKIIKLPYCPIPLNRDDDYITIPSDWTIETSLTGFPHILRYKGVSLTDCFENYITFMNNDDEDYSSPFSSIRQRAISTFGTDIPRNKEYETKLLHSDFYVQKFVYDSFAYDFKGEFMPYVDGPMALSCYFYTSAQMTSTFMFRFDDLQFTDDTSVLGTHIDTQNYTDVLFIRRNNELPIYNSAYINYIRTGYNFDVKSRDRNLRTNIITSIAGTTGTILSALAGGPFGAVGAVALGTGTIKSITSMISSTAQADQNIAEKLRTAEMQGLSIAGSDDIDLMNVYTNENKAKLVEYKVSEKMEKVLYDLFYYCGYVANYQGIPETHTRKWFNFIQADVVFEEVSRYYPDECLEELKKKFRDGLTIFHRNLVDGDYVYDISQTKENWEINV